MAVAMEKLMSFILWSYLITQFMSFNVEALCQANIAPEIPRMFATKTAYEAVRGTEVKEEVVPGCEVIQHYLLSRHGTRYDDAEDNAEVKAILEDLQARVVQAHANGKGELCADDLEALKSWRMRMVEDNGDMQLAPEGWNELRQHGERNKQRFPSLLNKPYNSLDFAFRHTDAPGNHRTRDSARAYAEGLFGTYDGVFLESYPNELDTLLKFYDACPKYIKTVDEPPNVERDLFEEGPEMKGVIRDVTRRLGLEDGALDFDTVDTIFSICGYDLGIYGDAPWISAFSYKDIQIFNYYEDLKYYWVDAYGHQINYEMPCELLVDVSNKFRSAIYNGKPVSVNRFGHSSTTNGMLAVLGLFKDTEPLNHDNFNPESPKIWNTSVISPMSASVQMALYKCDDGKHRVKSFVNEKSVILPGCSAETCLLDDIMKIWQPIINKCNFHDICITQEDTNGGTSMKYTFVSLSLSIIICQFLWISFF